MDTVTPMTEAEVETLIANMNQAIRRKMLKNLHKGTPIGLHPSYCFKRLLDESGELYEELFGPYGSNESAMDEAADVACFAFYAAMNKRE